MAKEKIKHERVARPKTAKQIAKAQANIAAYNARNERLSKQHQEAAEKRREAAAKFRQNAAEQAYINAALDGPHAFILNRWLKNRAATFERVSRFFTERPHFTQPPLQKVA